MNIRGIILAGGSSRRMGTNKLMLEYEGKPIIQWTLENSIRSNLTEVVLVYGEYDIETETPVRKIYNYRHLEGMSTTIKAGMEDFHGDGVMLLLGDMPFVSVDSINKLIMGFSRQTKNIAVPVFNGKRGNPVIIGKKYFQCLIDNTGDKGARDIISSNMDDVEFIEMDNEGIFIDIDDKVSYDKLIK